MDKTLYLRYVLESASLIPAALCALLPARRDFKYCPEKLWIIVWIVLLGTVFGGALVCMQLNLPTNSVFLPAAVILSVVYCFVVEMSFDRKLFCLLNAAMLIGFCTFYTVVLAAPIEESNPEDLFFWETGAISLSLSWIVTAFFLRTLSVKLPALMHTRQLGGLWKILMFLPLILEIVFFTGTTANAESYLSKEIRPTMLGIILIIPIAVWLIYHLLWGTATRIAENARLRNENMLLRMEQKRYYELRTYVGDTRTMRHDFRQHVHVIRTLLQEDKTEELKEYLKNFTDDTAGTRAYYCSNDTLDAILSHYDQKAREKKIDISWRIDLPKEIPVNEMEFCAMIGNLLENAVQATEKLPEGQRKIRVISEMVTDSMIGFSMDNTFEGKLKLNKNGFPRSTRAGHGVGLQSVANTVRRYNGTMDIQIKENVFSVNILMNGKTASEKQEAAG